MTPGPSPYFSRHHAFNASCSLTCIPQSGVASACLVLWMQSWASERESELFALRQLLRFFFLHYIKHTLPARAHRAPLGFGFCTLRPVRWPRVGRRVGALPCSEHRPIGFFLGLLTTRPRLDQVPGLCWGHACQSALGAFGTSSFQGNKWCDHQA